MKDQEPYIRAYHQFKSSVDLNTAGFLPELDHMVWYLLVGVPPVPADDDPSEEARMTAIEQRVNILKAVFVEVNRDQADVFLDEGLSIYDEAARLARDLSDEEIPIDLGDHLPLAQGKQRA